MLTVLLAAHSYNKGAANNLTTTTHPHKKHAWQQAQGGPASRPHQKISTFFLGAANETMSTKIPKQKNPNRRAKERMRAKKRAATTRKTENKTAGENQV